MNELALALCGFGALLFLILLRTPIAIAMAVVGTVGMAAIAGWPAALGTFMHAPFGRASSYTLATLPLFIMMGVLAGHIGMNRKLFHAAEAWIGHWRGGLAMATIGACAGFGAVCGSAIATTVTMCHVALPEMRRRRYADGLATGAIAAGGTLGILIPPSVILVIYGIMTEQSIGRLLAAGILPGILLTILYMVVITLLVRWRPGLAPSTPAVPWRARLRALAGTWDLLLLFGLVMGSLYGGFTTPTESAAYGLLGMIGVGSARRTLDCRRFRAALDETMRITAMIYFIIVGADLFGNFIALTQMPMTMADWLGQLHVAPGVVLWCLIGIYIILGGLMDELAMILLTVPLVFPLMTQLGFNPIWFGIVIVLIVQMGLITPPVAMNVFVVGGAARDIPIGHIYRGTLPFIAAQLILLGCLTSWPDLALLLPRLMK